MITRIELENFKRFEKFLIKVGKGNILVGPNNSGKSSILDALRILDACFRYSKRQTPKPIKTDSGYLSGYDIPESYLPVSIDNIARNYDENDATIKIAHENGSTAVIKMNQNKQTTFCIEADGKSFVTSTAFRAAFPIEMVVVPTLAPLEANENWVVDATVNKNKSTRLAARSFRNIWLRETPEKFEVFKQRTEAAWPGIVICKPNIIRGNPTWVEMNFEENRIPREIIWAGFGFQIWLQIHMHLLRGNRDSILVLDEPDIYLHPDLQHRLYHDVSQLFHQYFIATHAPEIINEADSKEILVINPELKVATKIKGDTDYEKMLSYIGAAENADFAKIARAKKVIFVEGHDAKIIRRLAKTLGLERLSSDRTAPMFQLGGFSQWQRAKSTVWAFRELLGLEIRIMCLFDKDYRSDEEVQSFVLDMEKSGINCIVLDRKEIENYLLSVPTIVRLANKKNPCESSLIADSDVVNYVELEADKLKDEVCSQLSSHYVNYKRKIGHHEDHSTMIKKTLKDFNRNWSSIGGKIRLAPGKELLGAVIQKLKLEKGVSLTPAGISAGINLNEIDDDIKYALQRIEKFLVESVV